MEAFMSSPMKFLIVDDFSTMRRIVRNLLKEIGHTDADETRGSYRVAGPDQFGGFGRSEHFAFHGCLPPGLLCLWKR